MKFIFCPSFSSSYSLFQGLGESTILMSKTSKSFGMVPSIFMTSIRKRSGQAHVDIYIWGRGSASCGCPHRKLELIDVTVFYSHAKKLASFVPEFRLWTQ